MSNIKLVNIKKEPKESYDLYIGRINRWLNLPQSKWHNPFFMKNEGQRTTVLKLYEEHIRSRPDLIAALPELEGKVLGCYCAPKRCHGNVLIDLYEEFVEGK
jgi:hypothetical protein